jgi:hypothetical protein
MGAPEEGGTVRPGCTIAVSDAIVGLQESSRQQAVAMGSMNHDAINGDQFLIS